MWTDHIRLSKVLRYMYSDQEKLKIAAFNHSKGKIERNFLIVIYVFIDDSDHQPENGNLLMISCRAKESHLVMGYGVKTYYVI